MIREKVTVLFSAVLLLVACSTVSRVSESVQVHDNYSGRLLRDSVFVHDSVRVAQKADTIFFEKVRTVFRDRCRVDTTVLRDTIYREKSIVEEKVVRQSFPGWRHLLFLLFLIVLCAALYRLKFFFNE